MDEAPRKLSAPRVKAIEENLIRPTYAGANVEGHPLRFAVTTGVFAPGARVCGRFLVPPYGRYCA